MYRKFYDIKYFFSHTYTFERSGCCARIRKIWLLKMTKSLYAIRPCVSQCTVVCKTRLLFFFCFRQNTTSKVLTSIQCCVSPCTEDKCNSSRGKKKKKTIRIQRLGTRVSHRLRRDIRQYCITYENIYLFSSVFFFFQTK